MLVNNGRMSMNTYAPATCLNNRVYNNSFHRNYRAIHTNTSEPIYGNVFKNNIFFQNREYELDRNFGGAEREEYYLNNNILGTPVRINQRNTSLSQLKSQYPDRWYGNLEVDPMFVDTANRDLRLQSTSPMIDAGGWLTTITSSSGSGVSFQVEDARYFMDGWGIIEGDLIQLEGQTTRARITNVDYNNNTITVDTSLTWTNGQGVSLAYEGSASDIGAYEYGY